MPAILEPSQYAQAQYTKLPAGLVHPGERDEAFSQDLKLALKMQSNSFKVQQALKRAIDLTFSLGGLLFILPVMLMIAALVKLTSSGPVLYKSLRIGRNNQPFNMYKFRTMMENADQLRDQLRGETQQDGELFKIKNDFRITPFGQFLRKYSLDEFPQLLNVIKGEMSLVGPRPFSPDNCKLFKEPYTLRARLTPGMTGKWQVSGRSDLTFQQACELDLSYVMEWNLLDDVMLLFKTIPVVLLKKGAF